MGSCLSCKLAGSKTQVPGAGPKPHTKPDHDDNSNNSTSTHRNENGSVKLSSGGRERLSSAKIDADRPSSGLEASHGREKKLSICSTYSDRPLHDIPHQIPEDSILTAHDFFNIINDGSLNAYIHDDGNFLIIDCRAKSEYKDLHVVTAKHFSELNSDPSFESGMGYSLFNIVIIYGNNIRESEGKEALRICQEISMNVAGDVLVLADGFDTFKEKFPFMCSYSKINTAWERRQILTYPSVIINEKLYQGKGMQATNPKVVQDLKITHIINITKEHNNEFPEKITYLRLPIDDEKGSNLLKYFEETSKFIENALNKKGVVFVHCNLGVSRSSAVVLAYLMKSQTINLEDAFSFLKSRRSCAKPNIGFLAQLSEWELQVYGSKVTAFDNL